MAYKRGLNRCKNVGENKNGAKEEEEEETHNQRNQNHVTCYVSI